MNKKDKIFILGCLIFALVGFGIYYVIDKNFKGDKGIVEYRNIKVLEFDLNKDDIYEIEGTYGIVNLEIKNGEFHVFDVECPNHDCEQMGWINKDSLFPIVCLPNEIVIYSSSK